jgi:transglutaminase-like putative cysteine protease
VLSQFDGQHWTGVAWLEPANRGSTPQATPKIDPVNYQITLEPNQQPWLLTLDATLQAPQVVGQTPRMTPDLQWVLTRPVTEMLRYQVESVTRYSTGTELTPAQLRPNLTLPPDSNPRTQNWAQQLKLSQPNPADRVNSVLAHLRSGGYSYTLEPGLYGRHSADEFWFDRKLGFCEHIAAGFVVLMRASGIPARVVTGYQGGERNPLDDFWTVRQSDAHAWAEVWLAGQGWVRVDPTSAVAPGRTGTFQRLQTPRGAVASALFGNVNPELALNLRAAWDAVNNRWNQWVLNYTQTRQLDLLKQLGFESPSWEDLIYVLCGLVVLVSLTGALWSAWERQHQDPWLRLLGRARETIGRAGLPVPPQSTPRQLVQLLQHQTESRLQHPALQAWLLRLEALRYAPQTLAPGSGQTAGFKQQMATLQRELKRLSRPPAS